MPSPGLNLFGQHVSNRGEILGCDRCGLNGLPGIRKIKGLERVGNQKAFLWAMCPGKTENAKGLELVGPAGQLLWEATKTVGLSRKHFAVQNVVRCAPLDEQGAIRDPSKQELNCCSIYNDQALERNQSNASVHVILGEVAATQLLGKGYRKDKPVFWSDLWNAYVLLQWHPSYLLRKGGRDAGWDYDAWLEKFRAARAVYDHPGRFGYVKAQDYRAVRTIAEFDEMEKSLREWQVANRRVSLDIEDGTVDGKRALLLAGFGVGEFEREEDWSSWHGTSWSVVLDHPKAGHAQGVAAKLKQRVAALVEDPKLRKVLQNGSYDGEKLREFLGVKLRGYDIDTQYAVYVRHSFLRSCRLEDLTYRFFPEFCDYKNVTDGYENFADVPLDLLLLRNCGDCDVTKRLEERFSPQVNQALMRVYVHAGITLDEMEGRGPLLDWENWKKAEEIVPKLIAKLDRQLQQISGDPNFNCGSDKQVAWLLYDHLKLPAPEGSRSTGKDILNQIAAETGNSTVELVKKNRALRLVQSTFLISYANCARECGGELRTRWSLTGAVSGRLRSSGGENDNRVNMQNIHGNVLLQNILVSDLNWRRALEE